MNRNQAEIFLATAFPGKRLQDGFMEMVKLFMQPLNEFIRAGVRQKNLDKMSFSLGGRSRTVSMTNYASNNPADVALRAILIAQQYPNWTGNYAAGKRRLDGAPETGEPITIAVVLTIIVALAPVVLPFVVDLVNSFLSQDTEKKELEQKAAQEANKTKLAQEEKKQKMLLIAGVGLVVAVGAIFVAYRVTT